MRVRDGVRIGNRVRDRVRDRVNIGRAGHVPTPDRPFGAVFVGRRCT